VEAGVRLIATEPHGGHVALPELLEDLGQQGHSTLVLEGGASLSRSFINEDLVDRIVLFQSPNTIGAHGIPAPVTAETIPYRFRRNGEWRYGLDMCTEWIRV
jgi:diaminohydroxyphosphoribosylaminopyrimidine deaminase / 5-amino-6-(5-phosphoribosylamino)uracil reductase